MPGTTSPILPRHRRQRARPGVPTSSTGIIGAGVSGLAAGIALLRRGIPATIYEAGDGVGGCCATTCLDGFAFNDGAMYVALPEILDHGFEQLGLDRGALLPMRQINALQTTTLPDGTKVSFRHGLDAHIVGADGREREVDFAQLRALMGRWEPLLGLVADELVVREFSVARLLPKG